MMGILVGLAVVAAIIFALEQYAGSWFGNPPAPANGGTATSPDLLTTFMSLVDPGSGGGDASSAPVPDYNPVDSPADGSPGIVAPEKIQAMSIGIAHAEGYFSGSTALPFRSNNPGDLTKSFGFPTTGVANKEGVLIFDTAEHGWNALYTFIAAILNGSSSIYSLDDTFLTMAAKYTGGAAGSAAVNSWAATVAQYCNLSPSNTLGDFVFA